MESDSDKDNSPQQRLSSLIGESRPVNIVGGSHDQRRDLLDAVLKDLDPQKYDVLRVDFTDKDGENVIDIFQQAGLPVPDSRITPTLRLTNAIEDRAKGGQKQLIVATEGLTDYDTILGLRAIHNSNAERTGPNILVITAGDKQPTDYQPKGDTRTPYNIGETVNLGGGKEQVTTAKPRNLLDKLRRRG